MDLATNRELTKAFINQLPVELVLVPRAQVKKPAGGFAWQELEPRAPQTFTLVEQAHLAGQPQPTRTADGVERTVEFMLIGEYDAEIARHDVFSHGSKEWEVIDLYLPNGYETRAVVSARG